MFEENLERAPFLSFSYLVMSSHMMKEKTGSSRFFKARKQGNGVGLTNAFPLEGKAASGVSRKPDDG